MEFYIVKTVLFSAEKLPRLGIGPISFYPPPIADFSVRLV